jgi:hypothetical protein
VTVTTGAGDKVPKAELRLPEEARLPKVERVSEAVVDLETPVPLEDWAVTVITEAADVPEPVGITPEEVGFPEIGKAPDVFVPSAVPVLPEGSAVTVTTEAPDDVPEAEVGTPDGVAFPGIGEAPDVVLPEGSAVTVTTEAADVVLYSELRAPDEVVFPEIGKAPDVVLPEGSAVTVTTEAAGDVLGPGLRTPEVRLPDTGKAPDVVVPTGVPVPEGSAVTVTTEAADDVPEAAELAAGSDTLVGGAVSVPLGGQAVTVTSGVVVDDEPELVVRLAETSNALDVAAPSVVPVLLEDPAVTVTVPAGSSVLPGPGAVTVTVLGASSASDPAETETGHEDTDGVIVTVPGGVSGFPGRPIETPTERPTDTDISGGMGTGIVGQAGPPEVSLLSKDRPDELATGPVARLDVNKSEDTLGKIVMVTGSFRVVVGALELLSAGSA